MSLCSCIRDDSGPGAGSGPEEPETCNLVQGHVRRNPAPVSIACADRESQASADPDRFVDHRRLPVNRLLQRGQLQHSFPASCWHVAVGVSTTVPLRTGGSATARGLDPRLPSRSIPTSWASGGPRTFRLGNSRRVRGGQYRSRGKSTEETRCQVHDGPGAAGAGETCDLFRYVRQPDPDVRAGSMESLISRFGARRISLAEDFRASA